MTYFRKPLKVAILGATGIGRAHARIYHELGAEVIAVLCSTDHSAAMAAGDLFDSFGVRAKPFSKIEEILAEPLDAISICTPPALHLQHMAAAFDRDIPVFCEKPLFWDKAFTCEKVELELENLRKNVHRRLFVNTSNTVFVDCIYDRLPNPKHIKRFGFQFYTKGPFHGTDIAVDLLPHGFSMLIRIFGERKISAFSWDADHIFFRCSFLYGDCVVEFDFQESLDGPRKLCFTLDNQKFQRIQEGRGVSYKVYLMDEKTNELIHSPDPFKVYLSRFLKYCAQNDVHMHDDFHNIATNLKLMAKFLEIINNNNEISY